MRFKLDENCDPGWKVPLVLAGHEAATAAEESLQGAEDDVLAERIRKEGLCLITADLDFAQILDYPPHRYPGLIVLRHPHPTLAGMRALIQQVAVAVSEESPVGRLWIVEPGRIRVHLREGENAS